jgi:hypothetical protein
VLRLHGFDGHETLVLLDGLSLASPKTTLPLMGEA